VPKGGGALRLACLSPSFYSSFMFRKPRQLESQEQLYEAAIKILARRAHSISEMKKVLTRRCEDEKLVKRTLERLKRENLLNDTHYAKQFIRQRTEYRKQGQYRIVRDLRSRGVPDRHIQAALQETAASCDPATLVRKRIERKLRLFRGAIDQKKLASLYRSLLGAGFSSELIRRELHRMTQQAIGEVETSDDVV
jgi:regulatory protein